MGFTSVSGGLIDSSFVSQSARLLTKEDVVEWVLGRGISVMKAKGGESLTIKEWSFISKIIDQVG